MTRDLPLRQFTDYRTFLSAHVQNMRRARPRWSYGAWARRLGLRDTSSITKIIQGKREPGPRITEGLVEYFGLRGADADYFRDLVALSKLRADPRLSVALREKIARENPGAAPGLLDEKTFAVISQWFHLPIRELVRARGFRDDPDWIARRFRFKLTAREARRALDALLGIGLLERDRAGRLRLGGGSIATSNDVASEAIRRYHEQMLENARRAVREVPMELRELQAESILMDARRLDEARKMIRDFRRRFAREFEVSGGDVVHQFQMQLFPLTRTLSEESEP